MNKPPGVSNELLIYERKKRNWTQAYVAEQIGAPDQKTIRRWEHGEVIPTPYYCDKLAELFGKSLRELGFPPEGQISFWHMPYRRNAFFTGRTDILHLLRETFLAQRAEPLTILPLALSGLGGVGKSQIALEYAYRYRESYHTVLWVHAASYQNLASDFAAVAGLLNLPEKDAANPDLLIKAVKEWLMQLTCWLLIFDNVEDLQLLEHFIPSEVKGHILLTTRSQSTGTLAHRITVETMDATEGARLLLHRAKRMAVGSTVEHTTAADMAVALSLSEDMGGLPLALDQAGAYIEENGCSLSDYLALYQQSQIQKIRLLQQRGRLHNNYPLSVVTTWSLAFEKIQSAHPVAVELLQLCAFLAPDSIPEALIVQGGTAFDNGLQSLADNAILSDLALGELLRYSFIRRNAETHTLTIHRLVQLVIRESLEVSVQHAYAEKAVRALYADFPTVAVSNYHRCRSLLPHVYVCFALIKQWNMVFPEAADLLHRAAKYLRCSLKRLAESELFYRYALRIREQVLGAQHIDVAKSLYGLALTNHIRGRYEQAEALYRQALPLYERELGIQNPKTLSVLSDLGYLLYKRRRYEEAILQHRHVLAIREQVLGPAALGTSTSLNNLALAYTAQGNYQEAEMLYTRALDIRERLEEPSPFSVAITLSNLGRLYAKQGRYEEAERYYYRAIAIRRHACDMGDSGLARSMKYLADMYCLQKKYEKAKPCYQQALSVWQDMTGLGHIDAVELLEDYADLLRNIGEDNEATVLKARAQMIRVQLSASD